MFGLEPVLQLVGNEFRTVVASKVRGDPVDSHRLCNNVNGIGGSDCPARVEGKALTGVFINLR